MTPRVPSAWPYIGGRFTDIVRETGDRRIASTVLTTARALERAVLDGGKPRQSQPIVSSNKRALVIQDLTDHSPGSIARVIMIPLTMRSVAAPDVASWLPRVLSGSL